MPSTVHATEGKQLASAGNHSQAELALIGEVPRPRMIDMAGGMSFSGVLSYSCMTSGMDDYQIADRLHISHGYMSRFLRETGEQWAKRLVRFMRETGCLGPLQWIAHEMGCELVIKDRRAAEIAELKAKLKELER